MKYFLDTEFIERPGSIQLISIGIVCEDGRSYYAVSKDFNIKEAWNRYDLKYDNSKPSNTSEIKNFWIRDNVLVPIYWELSNQHIPNFTGLTYNEWRKMFTPSFSYFKKLIKKFGKSNSQIATEIEKFCYHNFDPYNRNGEEIEFYAYYADYDWVVFCWLFGRMIDLPKGFPMYCRDLKQMLDDYAASYNDRFMSGEEDFQTRLSFIKNKSTYPKQQNEHNALSDAKWNKELYEFLVSNSKSTT